MGFRFNSCPYGIDKDKDDNIRIGDAGGALVRFDPRTKQFTFYPSPQRGDVPKIEITRDGASARAASAICMIFMVSSL